MGLKISENAVACCHTAFRSRSSTSRTQHHPSKEMTGTHNFLGSLPDHFWLVSGRRLSAIAAKSQPGSVPFDPGNREAAVRVRDLEATAPDPGVRNDMRCLGDGARWWFIKCDQI